MSFPISIGSGLYVTMTRVRGEGIKLDRATEILGDIVASGDKAVVFSYLLQPLDILHSRLLDTLPTGAVLNLRGDMSAEERQSALVQFKNPNSAHVLLCSLRVAGEGLTLTEANHVIFLNEWWNPSANAQARDRVVRIGQAKGVRVYKFKCKNTIEEDLDEILTRKTRDFATLVDKLAKPTTTLDEVAPLVSDLLQPGGAVS